MVQTLGTDANNDLYLGPTGNLVMLSGIEAVAAACATATKAQLGEMVLATNAGIPNFQAIWVGVPNYALWKQYLIDTLKNVEGVVQVSSLTMASSGGVLSYTATIQTIYGETQLNG